MQKKKKIRNICDQCGHKWKTRYDPDCCASCGSEYWNSGIIGKQETYEDEIIESYYSEKFLQEISDRSSFYQITKNMTFYIFGYVEYSIFEEVLFSGKLIAKGSSQYTAKKTGKITRFEAICNDDPYIYFGGSCGTTRGHMICISNPYVIEETILNLDGFTVFP